ncbi:helix-turn-helix domain-containing protein [Candidatus Omnitrophota bacterium]
MKEVLTITEASRYLRVNKATIYKLAQQGTIPAFKVGKVWRFKRDRIEAWVDVNSNNKGDGKRG